MEGVKTIREIADLLGTNRQKVWRIVRSLDIKERFSDGNRHMIADEDIPSIRSEFIRLSDKGADGQADKPVKAAEPSRSDKDGSDQAEKEAKITILEERISLKDELIAEKDKRIAELKAEIEKDSRMIEDLQKTIQDQAAALLKSQETLQGQMLLEAAKKPKLLERIKSHFSKTTPPAEG